MSTVPSSAPAPTIPLQQRPRSWPRALAAVCIAVLFAGLPAMRASGSAAGSLNCGSTWSAGTPPVPFVSRLLGAPTDLTANAGDFQVTLSWNPPPLAKNQTVTQYDIYEGTTSHHESIATILAPPTTPAQPISCMVTGLNDGTTYYFEVTAAFSVLGDPQGQGPPSGEASATPGEPGGPTATPGQSTVMLSWTPPPGAAAGRRLRHLPGNHPRRRVPNPGQLQPRPRHHLHRARPEERHHLLLHRDRRLRPRPPGTPISRGIGHTTEAAAPDLGFLLVRHGH